MATWKGPSQAVTSKAKTAPKKKSPLKSKKTAEENAAKTIAHNIDQIEKLVKECKELSEKYDIPFSVGNISSLEDYISDKVDEELESRGWDSSYC
jgi:hypothetical protein